MPRRIVHYNWIYQTISRGVWDEVESTPRQVRVCEAVKQALSQLSFEDREFVDLYWFQGHSLRELGELLGKKPYRLECMNRKILRKLKNLLTDFVKHEFGEEAVEKEACQICNHPRRDEIDILLHTKKPEETYRRIITTLKQDFLLSIKTPQTIIGHIKYHTKEE